MKLPNERLPPVHPGDVLFEDFMKPMGLSACAVAKAIGSTPVAISQICRHKRNVSAEMALKLGRYFGVSPELWMGIQADYDLEMEKIRSQAKITSRIIPITEMQGVKARSNANGYGSYKDHPVHSKTGVREKKAYKQAGKQPC